MSELVPTTEELQRLPLRAVAAYAVSSARRVAVHLKDLMSAEVLNDALARSEAILRMSDLPNADRSSLLYAVSALYGSLSTRDNDPSRDWIGPCLCLARSARAVDCLAEAGRDPSKAMKQMERAARFAEAAVRPVKGLRIGEATIGELVRRDYGLLVTKCGWHEDVVMGDPDLCLLDAQAGRSIG